MAHRGHAEGTPIAFAQHPRSSARAETRTRTWGKGGMGWGGGGWGLGWGRGWSISWVMALQCETTALATTRVSSLVGKGSATRAVTRRSRGSAHCTYDIITNNVFAIFGRGAWAALSKSTSVDRGSRVAARALLSPQSLQSPPSRLQLAQLSSSTTRSDQPSSQLAVFSVERLFLISDTSIQR